MSTDRQTKEIIDTLPVPKASNPLNSRFYKEQFPQVGDVVVVQVKSIAEMGAYVSLLEYEDVEGMILLSELSRRRIRSVNKLIRVGRIEYVVVLRVDQEKGYIDLSKRRVAHEEIVAADKRYNKAKTVHSLLRHLAGSKKIPLSTLYETIAWPLADIYGHAYDAFKLAITEPDTVFAHLPNVDAGLRKDMQHEISERLTPQPVRVRADVEVTCYAYEGVDAVKEALLAGQALETEHMPIRVKLVAPPLYVLWCTTIDKDAGILLLEQACEKISQVITDKGGDAVVKIAARSVTEREEADFGLGEDEMSDSSEDDSESGSDDEE